MPTPTPTRVLPAPRGWQHTAIATASAALTGGGRGQIRAACGTGKTLTAAHIAARLCPPGGLAVVACPSVALLAQTLDVWRPLAADVLAVCGDDTVTDPVTRPTDLPATVTTDPATITAWLHQPTNGLRLVATTHQSAGLLGAALHAAGRAAELLVVDEAHHSAGHAGKHTALLHDDATFPAARRLYATATPRVADTGDDDTLSMDDPAVFGPVLHHYSFAQAIADDWLDDYRICIVGVTRAELLPLLRTLTAPTTDTSEQGALRTAMVATALARAAVAFDLRRVICYHPRVDTSRTFAASLAPILAALPETARPAAPLTCHHVDGRHTAAQRRAYLTDLAHPPNRGWTVLSNARCLGEGVDVPAVDTVVFSHPKTSTTDIVQAIGRALRRNPAGSGTATILVPILVTEPATADLAADLAGYTTIWHVVRAMRAHDESLAAALDLQRARTATAAPLELPDRITVRLPDGYDVEHYLQHLTVHLVAATTSPWWEGYGAASAYRDTHGHLDAPVEHRTDTGFPLGRWLHHQRKARRSGVLPAARTAALDSLDMAWNPRDLRWHAGLRHATAYHAREGHLRVPLDHVTDDSYRLGRWIRQQRKHHNAATLAPDRAAALDALGIEWRPYQQMWARGITAARAFHTRHGHLRVPPEHTEPDGYRLGQFIVAQRMLHRRGTLAADRVAALDALGIVWHRGERAFATGLAHAQTHHRAHGTLRLPASHTTPDGYRLGAWLKTQRDSHRRGRLTADRAAALDAISPTWRG